MNRPYFTKRIFLLLIYCFSLSIATGQETADQPSFHLKDREVMLNPDLSRLSKKVKKQEGGLLVYVRFKTENPHPEGIQIESYLGSGVYSVYFPKSTSPDQLQNAGLKACAAILPGDKINDWWQNHPSETDSLQNILVAVLKNISLTDLQQKLTSFDATLNAGQRWKGQGIWSVKIPFKNLEKLAAASFVKYIQPQFKDQALNVQAIGFTNTEIAHQPVALGGYNLKGEGVSIGIGDNADPRHIDYIDRVTSFNPAASIDHGTHTVGTVGGNGIKDENNKGFAPESNLIADFFSQILTNAAVYNDNFGMVVTNNSYGMILGDCSYEGTYDLYSRYLDQQAFDIPDLLNVFAAANDGRLTCSPFPLGYATVSGSYSTAKNILTVANIGKTRDRPNQSSSCGPVKDGRLKPEITAVGTNLVSTAPRNNYMLMSGTSMATPNVAGAAGLLYQRFRQLNGGQNPGNALVKNILMNGADDIDVPGPDFKYGFGLMNIGHSLRILDSNRYFSNQINTGQTQTISITIPPHTARARIMLNWNDPPADPASAKALVNDLDLSMTGPGSTRYLPLVPDPAPGQVTQPAQSKADHLNNVEQIVLNNPVSGRYDIRVSGYNVPQGSQKYFVSYDFDPEGIKMQYPFGGEALVAGDSVYIYWEASEGNKSFSLSYSTDNGNNWQPLDANIAAEKRAFIWYIPATIASAKCLIRVQRNNETAVTKDFTIIGRPVATLRPSDVQCPGNIKFTWTSVPGADQYRIFKKAGVEMLPVAGTSDTFYTLSGLSQDSTYWIAVAPVIDGKTGIRSIALSDKPDHGNCAEVTRHGDLSITQILNPQSGRRFTSTALSAAEPLQINISNQDNLTATHYRVAYQINNGPWQGRDFTNPINPGFIRFLPAANLNLAATGDYDIKVAVTNLALPDPVPGNDTVEISVRQLANDPLDLSNDFLSDFESFPKLEITGQSVSGVGTSGYWDFTADKAAGRMRSYVNSGITISGNRSVSLDNAINEADSISESSLNTFTGTFNLSNYQVGTTEIRCSFDYYLSGVPKFDSGNKVWIRGKDTDPWLPLLDYRVDPLELGSIFSSGSLSLNDILAAGGQNFSSSTQIKFTQKDTSKIASAYYGNGLTMDNFKLYVVKDDIEMLTLNSVLHYNCALSNAVPLTVTLRNGVNNTVPDITINYKLDNQNVVSEMIDSIPGKDTLSYTFATPMDLSAEGSHQLSVWVYVPTDNYHLNDSINDFSIRNQPVIDSFPYLQDFEKDDGSFYTDGKNDSWQYGKPAATKINHAASGQKAWKTNLTGPYNDLETSFLYAPCFDISRLKNPTLSFSLATDIEAPGETIYDQAYLEYTTDGINWKRLGAVNEGYNWYNNDSAEAWTEPDKTYWHVATIPLPRTDGTISFRFVLKTDPGATYEGVAVDDIHVYDLKNPIFDKDSMHQNNSTDIAPQGQQSFIENNQIALSLINGNNALNKVSVQDYGHEDFINADSSQYFLPRNFTIKAATEPSDSLTVRFYIPGDAMKKIRDDRVCYSCSKPYEVQQLGITQYKDQDIARENNSLRDNKNGQYTFIPQDRITWVPYDKGYYAVVKLKSFSEFWFNDGGPGDDQPVNQPLFDFQARHLGNRYVRLRWHSGTDEHTINYEVQRADTSMQFHTIARFTSLHDNDHVYQYTDTPSLNSPYVFYRILHHHQNEQAYSSMIRRLDWSAVPGIFQVYPNPVRNGMLTMKWFKGNDAPLDWAVYNILGQLVMSGKIEGQQYEGTKVLDLKNRALSSGIYLLKVRSDQENWTFKIVFE